MNSVDAPNKTALVTGANQGLGFALVKALAEKIRPQDAVYLAARSEDKGRAADEGWPEWINIPSKIGQVAAARVAARDIARARPDDGILINAVCPGLMDTAASRPWFGDMSGALTPEQAAVPVVELLLSPPGTAEPSGELLQFGKVLPWL